VTAATLQARDDLGAAAISMHRLGSLTSGMWRALSRELVTAAERLDRQSDELLREDFGVQVRIQATVRERHISSGWWWCG